MRLKLKDKIVFIADDSPNAKKIAQGFDFDVDEDNKVSIKTTSLGMKNKFQLANAIKEANNIKDIKVILLAVVDLLDGVV